jgi:FkbM family methyltransferase
MSIGGTTAARNILNLGASVVKRNPYAWYFAWHAVQRVNFFLPHEKDYFGLRHLGGVNKLILDVGGNTGISALGFRAIGLSGPILSIEANPLHEPALKRVKQKIKDFDYRIMAAGCRREELELYTPVIRGFPMHPLTSCSLQYAQKAVERDFSSGVKRKIKYVHNRVNVIPLDELNLKPGFIKIDVEGFDDQVLLGLRQTIIDNIPEIFIEYTPGEMASFEQFFKGLDYMFFMYDSKSDTFDLLSEEVARKRWRDSALQVNLFCVPREKSTQIPRGTDSQDL